MKKILIGIKRGGGRYFNPCYPHALSVKINSFILLFMVFMGISNMLSAQQSGTILTQADFTSGTPSDWVLYTSAQGSYNTDNGYARGVIPSGYTPATRGTHINLKYYFDTDSVREIYIQFRARMPFAKYGCKFVKIHGKDSDGGTNYANTTFGTWYTTGDFESVSHGTGVGVGNDTDISYSYDGTISGTVRSDGAHSILTPENSTFTASDWGTDWHTFKLHCKYNSGTSSEDEVADGEYYVEVDGNVYLHATGIYNRHPTNLGIDYLAFYGWAQDGGEFTLDFDDIIISTGGFVDGGTPPTTYNLTVNSGSGDGSYTADTPVNISANAPPTGQVFSQWTGSVSGVADVYAANTTITMPAANTTVTATYEEDSSPTNVALNKTATASDEPTGYPASAAVDDNTGTLWSTGLGYPQWLEVDLGDVYSINSTELVCYQDRAYQYTVDVKTTSGGSYTQVVDRSANTTPGSASAPITDNFTATNARYVRITVTGASGYTGSYISLGEFRVFGEAAPTTYALTVNSGSGSGIYEESEVVDIAADTAPANKEFDQWTGDVTGVADVNSDSTTITMPAAAATVTATYKDILYSLSVGSGSGDGNYAVGTVVNISADTPPSGQQFSEWIGDVANVANVSASNTSITMPAANATVTATYTAVAENVALNKTATASSEPTGYPASAAVDDNTSSIWSAQTYSQWLEVDLGDVYSISSTQLVCYLDRAYQFTVDVKTTSGGNYTQIVDRSANTDPGTVAAPITDNFASINARYVKITVTGAYGYAGTYISLAEFRVFGVLAPASSNLALNKAATASSEPTGYPASAAVDDNTGSIWSAQTYPQWLEVDLGDIYSINSTEVVCYQDRAYQFTVDAKTTSGGSYTQIVDRSTNTDPGTVAAPITDNFASTDARYVRITVAGASGYSSNYISLAEFRVFGVGGTGGARIGGQEPEVRNESVTDPGVIVYPNPSNKRVTIIGDAGWTGKVRIEVYTLNGIKTYQTSVDGALPHEVDISSYVPGIYFIKVSFGDKHFTHKVVKE